MQNIVTLGEINDALKFTTVTAAQLAEMGFAALANKPICEALPQEEARRLRTAKLYPAESIGQIRVTLAKRLAAPASCLHQIQEPAPVIAVQPEAIQALRALHDSVELAMQRGALSERALEIIIMQPATDVLMRAASQAAPAAVAAPDSVLTHLDSLLDDAAAHIYPSDLRKCQEGECTVTVASVRMGNRDERSVPLFSREQVADALAATPAADAPLYAEMLAALQSVGMDAVGVGGGENTISDSARAKVEAVLEKIGAPWPSSDTAAAAPVVLPEPVYTMRVNGRMHSSYTPTMSAFDLEDGEHKLYTEQQVRALLATATGLPAQAVPLKLIEAINTACDGNEWQGDVLATDLLEPACRAIASLAPQAQADARDPQLLAFAVSEIRRDWMEHAPVLYVSKGQLDNHRDPDGPDSTVQGRYLPARVTPAGKFTTPLFAAPQDQAADFQQRVQPWMMACFGPEISADRIERNHRFLEESLELVQSLGCTASEAHQLVDYVFGRPVGEPVQEAGGVMVTLAALCLASGLDMHACGETELARIWTKVEAIRAKQAAKPKHSPLPMHALQAQADARDAVLVHLDGLLDDAAAHIYPSDLNKFQTGEHTATVASVRMGNSSERSVPLYSREQVVEAFNATQAAQGEKHEG